MVSVQREPQVRLCLPGGLHEPVLMEVLANAVGETVWNQDHVAAAIDSRGDMVVTGLQLELLVSGLSDELSRWSSAAKERGDLLRRLSDLDPLPADRVDELMEWQHCVLRHEHATMLLASVRAAAPSEHRGHAQGWS